MVHHTARSARRRTVAALTAIALVVAACGSDGDSDEPVDDTAAEETADTASEGDAGEDAEPAGDDEATESADDGEVAAAAGGSVVFAAEQWPECLNPVTSCANASWLTWSVIHHVLPKLMEVDAEGNYQASPVLTEAPSLDNGLITEDPFTITFPIAEEAVWNDGTPITAEDVAFTWRAIIDSTGTLSTTGYELITDIDTTDPKAPVVTFSENYAPWADLFGGGTQFLIKADEFSSTDTADEMLDMIGFSGAPWILQSWSAEEAVLVPNDAYWDEERIPLLDQVTFVPREDTDTEIIALQTGEVSAIFPQPSPGVNERLDMDGIDFTLAGGVVFEGLWMNQQSPQSPILANPAVREALAFAIDRQEIVDTVMAPVDPNAQVLQCGGWVPTSGTGAATTSRTSHRTSIGPSRSSSTTDGSATATASGRRTARSSRSSGTPSPQSPP